MKILVLFLSASVALIRLAIADEPQVLADKREIQLVDLYPSFKSDWNSDFNIRPGMEVDELTKYIAANNAKVRNAKPPAWETREFHPPAYAYKELRLYVFLRMKREEGHSGDLSKNALTYWVNGRTQFWMDLAIENDKVKNIYISIGNWSQMMPAFRLAGEGARRSEFFFQPPSSAERHDSGIKDPVEP